MASQPDDSADAFSLQFDRHGAILSTQERKDLAKKRGICFRCGVRTHKTYTHKTGMLKKLPITNSKVYNGICLTCNPEKRPAHMKGDISGSSSDPDLFRSGTSVATSSDGAASLGGPKRDPKKRPVSRSRRLSSAILAFREDADNAATQFAKKMSRSRRLSSDSGKTNLLSNPRSKSSRHITRERTLLSSTFPSNTSEDIISTYSGKGKVPREVTHIQIDQTVTTIGDGAFEDCSSLSSVTIPPSVTTIGDYAFNGCSSLSSVTIPSSVTTIGGGAFKGCSSISSVTIPSSVTTIGDGAFKGCSSLSSVTIPSSVTTIGDDALSGCSSLSSVTMHGLPHNISMHKIISGRLTESLLELNLNCLTHIDPTLLKSWKKLKTLNFSQCELVDLPSGWNIPTLERLILAHNQLEHFPSKEILQGLPELQCLDMHDNKVSKIVLPQNDESVLCKLKTLRLGYNQLTELPLRLSLLESLCVLQVSHNKLTRIPKELCNMRQLRELEVFGNPLVQPPLEVSERGIDVMRRFYASCLEEEVAINTTLKVVFVGMSMSGKTSIIKRLMKGQSAKVSKSYVQRLGVKIYGWNPKKIIESEKEAIDTQIQLEDEALKMNSNDIDVDVKFNVWDFACQHICSATNKLFFSPRALYVLVWDMGAKNDKTYPSGDTRSDSDDDKEKKSSECVELEKDIDEKVQFWIDTIQTCAPGAAILPVASHADLFVSSYGDSFDDEEAKRRCTMMKERLLEHEQNRTEVLQRTLDKYCKDKLADSEVANRLRDLLSSRPKLLFGTDKDQSVVRVSPMAYIGFDDLRRRIVHIASGRERGSFDQPIFQGHVGTRIPRIYLEVRSMVRNMRSKNIHGIESEEFLLALKQEKGIDKFEDVCDALHFLANVGELCYFGDTLKNKVGLGESLTEEGDTESNFSEAPVYAENENSRRPLIIIKKSVWNKNEDVTDSLSGGLPQFIFLNPIWLVASVACILDKGLSKKLHLKMLRQKKQQTTIWRFCDTKENCPIITAENLQMLWEEENYTKVIAENTIDQPNKIYFDYLLALLVRFGVFVRINLNIDSMSKETKDQMPCFFFLPCLLEPLDSEMESREEVWTYKTEDARKTTICNSILFLDVVPPGLMERVTSTVLDDVFSETQRSQNRGDGFCVVKLLCWQSAFLLKVRKEDNITKIFCHLVGEASEQCVASKTTGKGMARLLLSGKGQAAFDGQTIWDVGFRLVNEAITRVLNEYGGLEFKKQCICPICLESRPKAEARVLDWSEDVDSAARRGDETLECDCGHEVNTALVNGYCKQSVASKDGIGRADKKPDVAVRELFGSVVLIGLLTGRTGKITRVGSGFIVNKDDGLIVTAADTVMNIKGIEDRSSFGKDNYGMPEGRIVVGVIPLTKGGGKDEGIAVFRYFAEIVAKDENIELDGVCNLDACVLRITSRLVEDVLRNGDTSFDKDEIILRPSLKGEKLQELRTTENFEHEENVRIIGFNQSGEGVLEVESGDDIDRCIDFTRGFILEDFRVPADTLKRHKRMCLEENSGLSLFKPRAEMVVMCQHSSVKKGYGGGPCVNDQGEVIGILCRRDELDRRRCYIVPTCDWIPLVKRANDSFHKLS